MHNHAGEHRRVGFTVVELIIVIAVVGILAGIVTVAYGGWRNRAATTEVKNELSRVASAMEAGRNFGGGYPASGLPSGFTAGANVTLTRSGSGTSSYCVQGVSQVDSTVRFYVRSGGGTDPKPGPCLADAPVITSGSAAPCSSAGSNSYTTVTLGWTGQGSGSVSHYRVYRGSTLMHTYNNTSSSPGSRSTSFTSEQWGAAWPYTTSYTLRAVSGGVESFDSAPWSYSFAAYC